MRILLLDDDPLFARSLERAFATASKAELVTATTIADARRLLTTQTFDLVLLDLQLEESDGLALLKTWTGELAMPPAIILSGHVGVRETVRCMRAGASSVLQKPATPEKIIAEWLRARDVQNASLPVPARASDVLIGDHESSRAVRAAIHRLAKFPTTNVLIVGETGVGKSTVARVLHDSTDASKPFVDVNCAAIPETLFESELFGAEAGAYTGSRRRKIGLLEQAGSGSIFLDEIGEMAPTVQPKLLRALENREFRRVGGQKPLELKARVISATHRERLGESETFRRDLYYRLAGFNITLAPLRERAQDIEELALHFLRDFCAHHPGAPRRLTRAAGAILSAHAWPGNLRELKSAIARAAIAHRDAPELTAEIIQNSLAVDRPSDPALFEPRNTSPKRRTLREVERETIAEAFRACDGNVSEAARRIGLPRSTVRDKLRRYGVA